MTVATSPRPKLKAIPDHPGVYPFRDRDGRVIYVGKAIPPASGPPATSSRCGTAPRTAAMVEASASLEWMLVQSEVEAAQLEYNLIKQHRPRYNVRYRDDKSYLWLAVLLADEIPRPRVERGPKRKGTKYFGPYAHAYADPETLDSSAQHLPDADLLQGVFDSAPAPWPALHPVRHQQVLRPCVGKVTPDEHRRIVEDFVTFMDAGRTRPTLQRLEAEMRQAAEELNFELAARLRDQLGSVRARPWNASRWCPRPRKTLTSPPSPRTTWKRPSRCSSSVGAGWWGGAASWSTRSRPSTPPRWPPPSSSSSTATGLTRSRARCSPVLPEGADGLRAWLAGLRGGPVDFRAAPGRSGPAGDGRGQRPRGLRHPQASSSGPAILTPGPGASRSPGGPGPARGPAADRVLRHLQLQGSQVVGSMVALEDGLARKSEYRRFEVRSVEGQDDVASLREVLTRCLARLATERDEPEDEMGAARSSPTCPT